MSHPVLSCGRLCVSSVLRIRVRCSRNEDQHVAVDPATRGALSRTPSQAGISLRAVDQLANDRLNPSSLANGTAAAAAKGRKEAAVATAAPLEASVGKAGGGRPRGETSVCYAYPRLCVLQASAQAGGTFEDVVRFSVEPPPLPPTMMVRLSQPIGIGQRSNMRSFGCRIPGSDVVDMGKRVLFFTGFLGGFRGGARWMLIEYSSACQATSARRAYGSGCLFCAKVFLYFHGAR